MRGSGCVTVFVKIKQRESSSTVLEISTPKKSQLGVRQNMKVSSKFIVPADCVDLTIDVC